MPSFLLLLLLLLWVPFVLNAAHHLHKCALL
jgi:hypothetical protein